MLLTQHSINSDWLFTTQYRVLQADWLILEINEKATLNINMPYNWRFHVILINIRSSRFLLKAIGCVFTAFL